MVKMNLIINELIYLLTSTLLHGQEMMTTIQQNTETVAVGDIYDKGTSALSSDPHSTAAMSSFMKVLKYVHLLKNCRNNCLYTAWLLTTLYLVDLCRPVSSIDGHWHLRSARRGQFDVHELDCQHTKDAFFHVGPSAWNALPVCLNNTALSVSV